MTYQVEYDGFKYTTDCPVFAHSISLGHSEPYPYDLAVVKRYLSMYPNRCRTYVDVGAHIGTTIAPYSRIFKSTLGFEANARTFEFLRKNIALNNISCRIEPFGLYSRACRGDVLQHAGGNSGCFFFRESETGSVECKTLDDYAIDDLDFLKIDVEGAELHVLQGAKETIQRCKPLIQMECNGLSSMHGLTDDLSLKFLLDLGYVLYDNGCANKFLYYPRIEPYQIVCFWGNTGMSEQRRRCLDSMRSGDCSINLITPERVSDIVLQTHPLHPAFKYLSDVHKADYLRTYCMHHYGGGYSDIKYQTGPWRQSFDELIASDAYINGYPEANAGCIAYPPLADKWNELVGNGAYICKPRSPLTTEWYSAMNSLLDDKLDALRANPARHSRDKREDGSGYPLEWNEMLGRIFHRVCYSHRDKILRTLPTLRFVGYL